MYLQGIYNICLNVLSTFCMTFSRVKVTQFMDEASIHVYPGVIYTFNSQDVDLQTLISGCVDYMVACMLFFSVLTTGIQHSSYLLVLIPLPPCKPNPAHNFIHFFVCHHEPIL